MAEIRITTFEKSNGEWVKTLTHIFYGDTLDDAIGIAEAHLITDYFFSSSLLGRMEWRKGSILILGNDYQILQQSSPIIKSKQEMIIQQLTKKAQEEHQIQMENGIMMIIESS